MAYRVTKCGFCKFWHGPDRCIPSVGKKDSDVVILAESPGKLECHPRTEEEPLIGESGGVLNWATNKAGLTSPDRPRETNVYYTNAVKCFPGYGSGLNPVDIQTENVKKCKYWLRKELAAVQPKYILCLGKHAMHTISGDYSESIEEWRGFWRWSKEFNCHYMGTIHPAAVIRGWGQTSSFYHDIERFTYGVKNGVPEQRLKGKYTVITKLAKFRKLVSLLEKQDRIAWDLETSSLEFWDENEEILGFGVCWRPGQAAYVPFVGVNRTQIWSPFEKKFILKRLKRIMERPSILKDGQNTKFDINWARTVGIDVRGVDKDTMQFHHLIDENTPTNLTYLTTYYNLEFPKYDEEIKPYVKKNGKKKRYETVPIGILGKYCCADCDAVYRISQIQRTYEPYRIYDKPYYELSVPKSKFAAEMERNGCLIDVDRIDELEAEYQKKIDEKVALISKKVGRENFNVNSPKQMQEVLFGDRKDGNLGLRGGSRTKTGKFSTDKTAMKFLAREYQNKKRISQILKLIEEIRTMKKLKSTYLTGFKKLVDSNNRVHTSYLTTGTVTGRLASEGPNLQNIPREQTFRELFIAGKGRKFIPADYSQIEYRMMAWLSNAVKLIKKFKDPKFDPHTYNSAIVRKIPVSEVTHEMRSYDKAVTFGINYGRSSKTIADEYNMPLDYVEGFIDAYFEEFPEIARWRKKQIELSKKNLYLENKSGRRRHFTAYEWIYSSEMDEVVERRRSVGEEVWVLQSVIGNMERQAMNYPVQSYSWDVMVKATDRVRKKRDKLRIDAPLVLTVHDMLGLVPAIKDAEKCKSMVENTMRVVKKRRNKKTGKSYTMEFPVDLGIYDCWVQ